jgi:hypothetical protein
MRRTRNRVIGSLAVALATAALVPTAAAAQFNGGLSERTATELGQAVGEPGEQGSEATALYSRTPTELGQRVAPSAPPAVGSSGFDWGDAAIGAGTVVALGLIAVGGVAMANRRARVGAGPSRPAVSS